jgi:hypothetical protein
MGRQSGHFESKASPSSDTATRLAEALLCAEISKSPRALLIRFDEPRDSNIVHKTLVALRDAYTPPRK